MKKSDPLLVSQIIPNTLQGEGQFVGEPSSFVRLSHCNLACSWCDTVYSWDENYKHLWKPYLPDEVEQFFPENSEFMGLVISGGEPLIWQKNDHFRDLIHSGIKRFKRVTLETNGTILPEDWLIEIGATFSCSPKLKNSDEKENRRFKPKTLSHLASLKNSYFKFVVSDEKDIREIKRDFDFIEKQKIYLMPLGKNNQELSFTKKKVAEICVRYGYQFSQRLHIELDWE